MTSAEQTRERTIEQALTAATAAPSLFNSQPWRVRAAGSTGLICADRARRPPVHDPCDRELLIVCGQLANVMAHTEYDRRPFTSTPVTADQISGLRIDAAPDSRPHAEPGVADIDAVARASRAVPHRRAAGPAARRHIDWGAATSTPPIPRRPAPAAQGRPD